MKKGVLFLWGILLLCGLFFLSGCSSPSIKEKQVFEDIKKSDTYCSTFDFEYDSMEVIKRMTDEKKKFDNVYVNFECHNDNFTYSVECIVNYVLYNEGWIFENYNIINSDYSATWKPTAEFVLSDFSYLESAEEWEQWEGGDDGEYKVEEPNSCSFFGYYQETVSEYFSWDITHQIQYNFTPETGWVGERYHEEKSEKWNWNAFVGKWEGTSSSYWIKNITILNISTESMIIDFYDYVGGLGEKYSGTFEIESVTGTKGIINYPNDIPIYKAFIDFGNLLPYSSYLYQESIYFTPYGIYDYICEENNGSISWGSTWTKLT